MIKQVVTWDKDNNQKRTHIYDQFTTVIFNVDECYVPLSWFKYDDANNTIPPFVAFVNNKLGVFCNDHEKLDYQFLSHFGKNLLEFYCSILRKNWYTDYFQSYHMNNKDYIITWKISKDFSMELNKETKDEIIINYNPQTMTKFEIMTNLLQDTYHWKIMKMVDECAKEMGLTDKISYTMIVDPNADAKYNGTNPFAEQATEVGVLGTSFKTKQNSSKKTYSADSDKKCVLQFSPIIYFMAPEDQKLLICHELSHIKVGMNHAHDSFFWATFEKFSGFSREDDWSWNQKIEKQDTEYYDKYWTDETGNNAYLIEKFINNNSNIH